MSDVTPRDLQALETRLSKQLADVNKRFNDAASKESVQKAVCELHKEGQMNAADLTKAIEKGLADVNKAIDRLQLQIDPLKADAAALKTAVSQLQTRAARA